MQMTWFMDFCQLWHQYIIMPFALWYHDVYVVTLSSSWLVTAQPWAINILLYQL